MGGVRIYFPPTVSEFFFRWCAAPHFGFVVLSAAVLVRTYFPSRLPPLACQGVVVCGCVHPKKGPVQYTMPCSAPIIE